MESEPSRWGYLCSSRFQLLLLLVYLIIQTYTQAHFLSKIEEILCLVSYISIRVLQKIVMEDDSNFINFSQKPINSNFSQILLYQLTKNSEKAVVGHILSSK